ncbi:FmdB family zinc ribbon protein [Halomonas alkalisoli]|uniref:FmdB family zinc ribbon protein n=1 Tax=Halomonas alkalisoli TaxID=2907158 RepID=UPI001F1E3E4D|nr:zinc ribbon domain-containing protein [Halomonas alkalisoli]MCE9684253.1 zinc ribbon domain-containing protein [Halomonas alkalisoli]
MPIYEYQCKACGHRLEKLQKISAAPLIDCPTCEAPELNRLVSAAGFRLAGGGWYETDFKSGSKKNIAGDTGGEAKPPAKGGETKPAKDGAAA